MRSAPRREPWRLAPLPRGGGSWWPRPHGKNELANLILVTRNRFLRPEIGCLQAPSPSELERRRRAAAKKGGARANAPAPAPYPTWRGDAQPQSRWLVHVDVASPTVMATWRGPSRASPQSVKSLEADGRGGLKHLLNVAPQDGTTMRQPTLARAPELSCRCWSATPAPCAPLPLPDPAAAQPDRLLRSELLERLPDQPPPASSV